MCSKPAPPLRSTLIYICAALEDLGVAGLTSDAFRQARQAEHQLAKALHTLVILSLAGFPPDCQHLLVQFWDQIVDEHACAGLPEQGFQFIHWQLAVLGYSRADQFCASAEPCHRELLLAFGWLLAKTDALQHALKRGLSTHNITALLPPYPQDCLQAEAAERQASHAALAARQHLQQVLQVCANQQGWAQVQVASQHALMLQAKCKAKSRILQSLHQSQCKLKHKLAQLQSSNQLQQHAHGSKASSLTAYEWSLLQSSEKLQRHRSSLEAAAGIAQECQQATQHAKAFFQWLSIVHQQTDSAEAEAQQVAETGALLTQGCSPAALPQLQQIVPRLQDKLQTAMQSFTLSAEPPLPSSSVPGPLLSQIQREIQRQMKTADADPSLHTALPLDIQQRVEAVRHARVAVRMPWQGFQLPAPSIVHTQFADTLPMSESCCTAKAEVTRLTQSVLKVAKTLAKVRAGHKQSLQKVVAELDEDPQIMVQL